MTGSFFMSTSGAVQSPSMNITSDFVFVHMPKTGGTFVSSSLGKIHGQFYYPERSRVGRVVWKIKFVAASILRQKLKHQELNEHGTCREIPLAYQHLPILGCIRHPFDWYVSNYKFAYWQSHPNEHPGIYQAASWPDLSFTDYLDLSNKYWIHQYNPSVDINPNVGRLTALFINFYCKDPDTVLTSSDDNLVASVRENMFDVTFLNTSQLNAQLFDYLSQFHSIEEIQFIKSKPKISPRNRRDSNETWGSFFSSEQMGVIRKRDRVIFELFPTLDNNS